MPLAVTKDTRGTHAHMKAKHTHPYTSKMNKSVLNFRGVKERFRRHDRKQECNTAKRFLVERNPLGNDERAAGIGLRMAKGGKEAFLI